MTPSGSRIHVLSDHVANKIAAGEVVERPASVVKELMENAVDAGARRIEVEIVDGGRKLVSICDDGVGMSRDDALLSIERHATSKIRDVDDIEKIITLGFRGEAIPAIASVSRFRLSTCLRGELVGCRLTVNGGTLQEVSETGGPEGTLVEVRDLFFNVPARRKFLRAAQTELNHVREVVTVTALAHPALSVRLRADGRDLLVLSGGGGLSDRVHDLFGGELARQLREVDFTSTGRIHVHGFAAVPTYHRADRSEQFFFVNGRPAAAPVLSFAIRESYHALLPKDRHPAFVLAVDLPAEDVDVNVHPTKREVRFRRSGDVRDAVIAAVRQALTGGMLPRQASADLPQPAIPAPRPPERVERQLHIEGLPEVKAFAYPELPSRDADDPAAAPSADESAAPGDDGLREAPWIWCRVVGQVGSLYVVLETNAGMVLIDPHAAHERVLYERYLAQLHARQIPVQALLIPETVDLSPRDAQRLRKHMETARAMGIGLSEFGGDAFMVDALPSLLAETPIRDLLNEMVLALEEAGARARGRWLEDFIAQAACRSAVRSRDRLSLVEIEQLVQALARADMPYTCPHGRPTMIFTAFRELDRKFGRS